MRGPWLWQMEATYWEVGIPQTIAATPFKSMILILEKVAAEVSWNFPPCFKVFAYIIL